MCDFEEGFILCTCNVQDTIVHNKNSRRYKKNNPIEKIEYIWTLYKSLGSNDSPEMGRYLLPVSDLGNRLSSEFVLNQLNTRNCFDFEYAPNEGDNLLFNDSKHGNRLEFIFKNGNWEVDHYSPFEQITKEVFKGKVKELN